MALPLSTQESDSIRPCTEKSFDSLACGGKIEDMRSEEWIEKKLEEFRAGNLVRSDKVYPASGGLLETQSGELINLASNDYLDLAHHPAVKTAARVALEKYGAGATSSRLVSGTLPLHKELEQRLAKEKGYPAGLLFGSGYMANVGLISSLVGRGDLIVADRLVHASIIDAALMSGARLMRFRHNDVEHLETLLKRHTDGKRKVLLASESVFSMDGDIAPLKTEGLLAEKYGAMFLVDEAHATGVFGPNGAGLVAAEGIQHLVNLSMGTLSKALGGYGGFVACSENLRNLMVHSARSFVYTTAPAPASIGAALGALDLLQRESNLGQRLLENAAEFRRRLREYGLDTLHSGTQIVPILIGGNAEAMAISRALLEDAIIAPAIRPPTVPEGMARLRLSVTLAHSKTHLERVAKTIATRVGEQRGAK